MSNAAIQLLGITEDLATTVRPFDLEAPEDVSELEPEASSISSRIQPPDCARPLSQKLRALWAAPDLGGDRKALEHRLVPRRSPGMIDS